jgi:2-(3-amino-3-carboxypropyl)histidine synthase
MNTLFLDAPYSGDVELCQETIKKLNGKKVALFASVQFVSKLDTVKKQLEEAGIRYITSQADRTHVVTQLLGCDNYHNSLHLEEDFDSFLYIGDGRFHPLALVLGQKELVEKKEVVCNDPIGKKMYILSSEDIERLVKKYKGALMKYLSSDTVGVIVTVKPGQEQLKAGLMLEEKYPDKAFYYFIDDNISFGQLENFPFIDVWVNTACPRIGFDDQEKFNCGVLNLNDALRAESVLSRLQ